MKIPKGYTETEVLKIIENVVNRLAGMFKFGYHDLNDIKQEGIILAIEALNSEKYDPNRANLEAFLYLWVKSRLKNFKRKKYFRQEPPKFECDCGAIDQSGYNCAVCDKMPNQKYLARWNKWYLRNTTKQNLNDLLDIDNINPDNERNAEYSEDMIGDLQRKDLLKFIYDKLPANLVSDYQRFTSGAKMPKNRQEHIKEVLTDIIKEFSDGDF